VGERATTYFPKWTQSRQVEDEDAAGEAEGGSGVEAVVGFGAAGSRRGGGGGGVVGGGGGGRRTRVYGGGGGSGGRTRVVRGGGRVGVGVVRRVVDGDGQGSSPAGGGIARRR
jgi:hypothetical protein